MRTPPVLHACARGGLLAATLVSFAAEPSGKKEKDAEVLVLSRFEVSGTNLGATPGGAKDIRFFRAGAGRGQIPHPDTFTAEGLFSEHDLPLDLGGKQTGLFRVQAAATPARFELLPATRYLAQLGLDSGLAVADWKPAPLNLVAVIDKSGSMSGEPLALVRASLTSVLGHLREGDQLSIVLYGDRSHVHLPTTKVSRATRTRIKAAIDAIASAGSTNMEEGLDLGFRVAREAKAEFKGNTRVMLFTDERPNVGNTEAGGFMAMATAASHDGIGLTTIGVGVQFGAELATRISSVRGGNLFFFSSGDEMKATFASEFDTLVTELAHDFSIRVEPAPGFRIDGVFGVPGEMLRWDGRALVMDVATIFLSRRKGGLYFALAPEESAGGLPAPALRDGARLAQVKFSYRQASDLALVTGEMPCPLLSPTPATAGLSRGVLLVDEYLTLKRATQAHFFANDQEAAFRLMSGLHHRFAAVRDRDLESEKKLVRDLHDSFALLSGHAGEIQAAGRGGQRVSLVGAWRKLRPLDDERCGDFLVIWPNGVLEAIFCNPDRTTVTRRDTAVADRKLPTGESGILPVTDEDGQKVGDMRFAITGDVLTVTLLPDDAESPTVTLTRAAFSEIPGRAARAEFPPTSDDISGLPSRGAPRAKPAALLNDPE